METPDNLAGILTEKIMLEVGSNLRAGAYNKTYSKVYEALQEVSEACRKAQSVIHTTLLDGAPHGHGSHLALENFEKLGLKKLG